MIFVKIKDVDLIFEAESSIFSPNSIDQGTLAMLSAIDFLPNDKMVKPYEKLVESLLVG